MSNKIKSEVFDLTKDVQGISFQDWEKIVAYVLKVEYSARGEENAKFYEHFRKLSNSINNAGWEERHSEQISHINKIFEEICDSYEQFLP